MRTATRFGSQSFWTPSRPSLNQSHSSTFDLAIQCPPAPTFPPNLGPAVDGSTRRTRQGGPGLGPGHGGAAVHLRGPAGRVPGGVFDSVLWRQLVFQPFCWWPWPKPQKGFRLFFPGLNKGEEVSTWSPSNWAKLGKQKGWRAFFENRLAGEVDHC